MSMRYGWIWGVACAALLSCGPSVPRDAVEAGRAARVEPDLGEATLPPNIAPVNFEVLEEGTACVVRVRSRRGQELTARGPVADFPVEDWHRVLASARGDTLFTDVWVKDGGGRWTRFDVRRNPVARDSVDAYITYRLIRPSYVEYEGMALMERHVEDFGERVLYSNLSLGRGPGQCVNCHMPRDYNRLGETQFHVRHEGGGTVISDRLGVRKVDLKTDSTLSAGVYQAWNPRYDVAAYSVNETGQIFHIRDREKVEVLDFASDLILYDMRRNKVFSIDCREDEFETFPAWSPDGRRLYYCSAHYERRSEDITAELYDGYRSLKYDIYCRDYDPVRMRFGPRRLVFAASAHGGSAAFPRVSPDGRWLLFSMGEYGQFHVWHRSADLWVLDLLTGQARPLAEANSPESDSYHSWSSNGRWILFTSRCGDGNYTRLCLSYFGRDGRARPAFVLPQRSPRHDARLFWSYNTPEWMAAPVECAAGYASAASSSVPAVRAEYGGSALDGE